MTRGLIIGLIAGCLFSASAGCPSDTQGTANNNDNNSNENQNSAGQCGDGVQDVGEACDDGSQNSDVLPDACRTDCRLWYCGDSVMDTGEACDGAAPDGLTCADLGIGFTDGSPGCTNDCELDTSLCTTCGNGTREGAEDCDGIDLGVGTCASEFGMQHGVLGCDVSCQYVGADCHTCGNGGLEGPEECDDGNVTTNDGCGADCRTESGWGCSGSPSVCTQIVNCTLGTQCVSNYCTDGVCCDAPCLGSCESCDQPGLTGFCTPEPSGTDPATDCALCEACNGAGSCAPAADGTDPQSECAPTATDTCGLDGECNGASQCRFWAASTVCGPQSCMGDNFYSTPLCSGTGSCEQTVQACEPYMCNSAGWECLTSCVDHPECSAGYFCDSGVCVQQLGQGTVCTVDSQCVGGNCEDGVCCASSCGGICESCDQAGFVGMCRPYEIDTDPDSECGLCQSCSGSSACANTGADLDPHGDCGVCQGCNGSGGCSNVLFGTDPFNECTQDPVDSCGQTGNCTGTGTCGLYPNGTECYGSCLDAQFREFRTCDGGGTCNTSLQTEDCAVVLPGGWCSFGTCEN